jgi:hypothetical protein
LVVGLVTSPRFDMPYKPLLAAAVVVVPQGYEVLMNLINSQWLYPIGVLVMLNMRAPETRLGAFAEYLFVALAGLTGPFSLFLCPIALALYFARRDRRLMIFSVILAICAVAQMTYILRLGGVPDAAVPASYSPTLWITSPAFGFTKTFAPLNEIFDGYLGVFLIVVCAPLAFWAAFRSTYRKQYFALAAFALLVVYSGMFKYRGDIGTLHGNPRYLHAGSVFVVWFLCWAAAESRLAIRVFILAAVGIALANSAYKERNFEMATTDFHWPDYAERISRGGPVLVPINPNWAIKISPDDSRVINLEGLGLKPD